MGRRLALTFDDGHVGHLEIVAPFLKDRGVGATFYVADSQVGRKRGHLNGSGLRALQDMGFDLGWHGGVHPPGGFSVLSAEHLADDMLLIHHVGIRYPACT